MQVRVSNVRLAVEEGDSFLPLYLSRALHLPQEFTSRFRILRKSLDVRNKRHLQFVYNAEVPTPEDWKPKHIPGSIQVEPYAEPPFEMPEAGSLPLRHRPVIVGSGPAGLLAAYFLAEHGYRPILIERGTPVNERIKDVKTFDDGGAFASESNYLFGEGGAGTFSDGKLTCRGTGPDVTKILQLFADNKGKSSVIYYHRPHLGSNRLPAVVKAFRRKIIEMGGEVRFHCTMTDIEYDSSGIRAIQTNLGRIETDVLVLATGHSARDVYRLLHTRGIPIAAKPFQMGVRVEHPQGLVNRVQFGGIHYEELLGNADYSLVAHGSRADLFTFCMCAGGYVIPSVSQEGYFCTNGMSLSKRDSYFANSGLVVTVPVEEFGSDHPLAGMHLQEACEKKAYEVGRGEYACPYQRASDFVARKASTGKLPSSYPRQTVLCDLHEVLPPFVARTIEECLPRMNDSWRGKFLKDAILVGPEARGSSPIRVLRDNQTRVSPGIDGLYPVGEGAGYAGGIVSAAVDGLRTARSIIQKYARAS